MYTLAWRVLTGESIVASAAAALRAFTSCGGTPQDRVTKTSQRILLGSALFASGVVIVSTYQGHMYTLMTKPDCYLEIDTVEQLCDSGLTILYTQATDRPDMLTEVRSKCQMYADEKNEPLFDKFIMKENMTYNTSTAIILTDAMHARFKSMHPIYFSTTRVMAEIIKSGLTGIYVRSNWPWLREIEDFFLRLRAGGILQHLEQRDVLNYELYLIMTYDIRKIQENDERRAFGLLDISPHFAALGVGLAIALLAFLREITSQWFASHWRQLRQLLLDASLRCWLQRVQRPRAAFAQRRWRT